MLRQSGEFSVEKCICVFRQATIQSSPSVNLHSYLAKEFTCSIIWISVGIERPSQLFLNTAVCTIGADTVLSTEFGKFYLTVIV